MPKIPVNPGDLPTEATPLDESLVYKAFCRSLILNDNPDKNGLFFLKARFEITEPDDYRGKSVADNYIPIPAEPDAGMDARTRARVMEAGIKLGRMLRSAGFKGSPSGFDTEEFIGSEVTFMIENDEYQGRTIPRVKDYLI